jgi:hypothetical protein
MPPLDASKRRDLILEALRGRAEEVARKRAPGSAPLTAAPADDAEEALRVVMVRLWPQLAADPSSAALERLTAALGGLRDAARGEDWRFLDAWNNAYETVAADEGLARTTPAQALFATYAELLDDHIRRLAR